VLSRVFRLAGLPDPQNDPVLHGVCNPKRWHVRPYNIWCYLLDPGTVSPLQLLKFVPALSSLGRR
jgi:hypothetical protein